MNNQYLFDGYLTRWPREWLAGTQLTLLNSYFATCYRTQGLFGGFLIATALADSSTIGGSEEALE